MKNSNVEERVRIATVVSDEGEILREIYDGDKIISKKQTEYTNKYITNFLKKEAFVKVYTNPIKQLFKELPTKEFAVAMALMPYISYKDGILKINNKITDVKNIAEDLNENYDPFRKVVS